MLYYYNKYSILQQKESINLRKFCDDNLVKVVNLLQIETLIAVGRFAEKRALDAFKGHDITNIRVVCLLHPSPIIPKNQDWPIKAQKQLEDFDLLKYFI